MGMYIDHGHLFSNVHYMFPLLLACNLIVHDVGWVYLHCLICIRLAAGFQWGYWLQYFAVPYSTFASWCLIAVFGWIEGDLKKVLAHETGLESKEQRLLFKGKEKENDEYLHMVGVKDMSKVILFEDPASKERKLEEMKRNQNTLKAYEAVARVRAEVDKLCEKVSFHIEIKVKAFLDANQRTYWLSMCWWFLRLLH